MLSLGLRSISDRLLSRHPGTMQGEAPAGATDLDRGSFELTVLGDNTGSMGQACQSARESFAEIKALVSLLVGKPAVRLAVYGDYDSSTPDAQQGGHSTLPVDAAPDVQEKWLSKYMKPCGGGGCPEAIVTSLNFHIRETSPGRKILFVFTDAPPHDHKAGNLDPEGRKESAFLKKNQMMSDWDELTTAVKAHGFRVIVFLTGRSMPALVSTYSKLGTVIQVGAISSTAITKAMMDTFYALIGDTVNPDIEPFYSIDLKAKLRDARPEEVLPAFEALLNPNRPDQAMCLVTNAILGRYWRLICGRFRLGYDGAYTERCNAVIDKLSMCKSKMGNANAEILKKWIDESHNDTEFIRKLISKVTPDTTKTVLCLTLPSELRRTISLDDVLLLGRTGECRELSKLFASMEVVNINPVLPADEEESPDFVPLEGLSPLITFRMVANLLSAGLMFSDTVAHLAAILALRNKHLHDMALDFLTERRGKWINLEMDDKQTDTPKNPLFYVLGVHRIFASAPDSVFTAGELAFTKHYLAVARISRNVEVPLDITVPFAHKDLRDGFTFWRNCKSCGFDRCFTLFGGDAEKCVFCSFCKNDGYDFQESRAHWAQCHTCHINYSVLRSDLLNVRPKCHYCRSGTPAPRISCHLCKNTYVDLGGSAMSAMRSAVDIGTNTGTLNLEQLHRLQTASEKNSFVCPRCVQCPSDMIATVPVKISELISQNCELKPLVPVSSYDVLMDAKLKLWRRMLKLESVRHDAPKIQILRMNGFEVHHPASVAEKIVYTLDNHSGSEMCGVCASDVPTRNMVPACGSCSNRICKECSRDWYSMIKPGGLVTHAHTVCMFCKTIPKHKVVRNMTLAYIRNVRPKEGRPLCDWNSQMIHALCQDCMMIKEFCERDCARETEPEIQNFRCDECRLRKRVNDEAVEIVTKNCPRCTAAVEKTGGCNHITCNCGAHWCWHCGKDQDEQYGTFDSVSVYEHLGSCGGVFEMDDEDDDA